MRARVATSTSLLTPETGNSMLRIRFGSLPLLAAGLLALGAVHAGAQQPGRRLPRAATLPAPRRTLAAAATAPGGRCAFRDIDVNRYGKQPFRNPPEIRSQNGRIDTPLVVSYTDPATTSIGGCPVTLRTYGGQLVGPTYRVRPGDVLAPMLDNRLPRESPAEVQEQFRQENGNAFIDMRPYSFNTTNLHTHGLHVSPDSNSDNVLLAIAPQTRLQYNIALPRDHTRGTYWYHAHTHGSTAIQVGSGMEGALIVDDDPATIPAALRAANEREKVMVIQTILYDTAGRADNIASFFPDNSTTAQLCKEGNPNCTWENSRRHVTINGQIVPVIHMQPGEVQRWRLIDAAFREAISLRLEGHSLHEIALDGIYTGRIDTWGPAQHVVLQPGYRSDVLVQASRRPGVYQLFDDTSTAGPPTARAAGVAGALRGVPERRNVIALVEVSGPPLAMQLPTQQQMAALNPFPGVDLRKQAIGVQATEFKLGSSAQPTVDPRNYFQVNYAAFDDSRIRYAVLDSTDVWSLTTVGDPSVVPDSLAIPPLPHIFHIHINPFQVVRTDPAGRPQLVWKDTQLVSPGDTINVYTHYTDFTGTFVLHCHILDHEDLGMMQAVKVVKELPLPHPRPNGEPDAGHGAMSHGSN